MAMRSQEDVVFVQRKAPFVSLAFFIFFSIVVSRLFYLQIYQGNMFKSLSDQVAMREKEIRATRGVITDRNGRVLADNRPYMEISIIRQYLKNKDKTLDSLTKIIPLKKEDILKKLDDARFEAAFTPVTIVDDAPYDWVTTLRQYEKPEYDENQGLYLEGVEVKEWQLRTYLFPELFAHALGYLKEPDKKGLEKLEAEHPGRYSQGDLMGASGVESSYDLDLRGIDGVDAQVVDARGKAVTGNQALELLEQRASIAPQQGNSLMTTLDYDTMVAAQKAVAGRRGAVVAIDPNTGEILALYSSPGYDPNRITKTIDKEYWQKINFDEDKFLLNRAIQATYPPGSIYKMVPALAGLDTGKVDLTTTFNCGGGIQFGSRFFKCWNHGGHGAVALLRGIAQSCDVYFYKVGLAVGVDKLKEYAGYFGYGHKTGIDIPFEQAGLIPSSEWKEKRFKLPWIESETLSISIGQGYDLVTPLQAARMVSFIANGGYEITPHLAKKIVDPNGEVVREISGEKGKRVIPEDHIKPIQQGMINVVHSPEGTAKRVAASPYMIAGKTGTAQVIGHDSKLAMNSRRVAHGWFVSFAPYDDPKIAVAVIIENGGSGSGAAAPVAMEVINAYLDKIIGREEMEKRKSHTGDTEASGGVEE
ncbi:penicillin-binding protein 2 [bacterium]|nr:penicillin-binding protein 2 [bacterium]